MDKPLIMFDFDGVLVDTLMACYEINTEANKELSLREYRELFNGNIFSSKVAEKAGLHPNFHGRYEEKTRELTVPPELKTLVRALAVKYTLAIVSSTPTLSIKKILEREGLNEYFSDVLGSDVDTSKVVKIKSLLEMYTVTPDTTIFITDTSGDVYEATECKVPAVGVTWGFQTKDMLAESRPFAIAESHEELAQILERFFAASAIQ